MIDDLEDAEFGSFGVLLPVLNYNYSWKIHTGEQIRATYEDDLSKEAVDLLDELLETLRFFGPAREYFKTLYFQTETINVSRGVLYMALPALALSGYMVVLFSPTDVSAWLFGITRLAGLDAAFLVVTAVYSLAIGPFILRETQLFETE